MINSNLSKSFSSYYDDDIMEESLGSYVPPAEIINEKIEEINESIIEDCIFCEKLDNEDPGQMVCADK